MPQERQRLPDPGQIMPVDQHGRQIQPIQNQPNQPSTDLGVRIDRVRLDRNEIASHVLREHMWGQFTSSSQVVTDEVVDEDIFGRGPVSALSGSHIVTEGPVLSEATLQAALDLLSGEGEETLPTLPKNDGTKDMKKYERTFGIELETIAPDFDHYITLQRRCSKNVNFDLHHDGSITIEEKYPMGQEIVTGVLKGSVGMKMVESLVDNISKIDIKTNDSCGFHVHIGAQDLFDNGTELLSYSDGSREFHGNSIIVLDSMFPGGYRFHKADMKTLFATWNLEIVPVIVNTGNGLPFKVNSVQRKGVEPKKKVTLKDIIGCLNVTLDMEDIVRKIVAVNNFYATYDQCFIQMCTSSRRGNDYSSSVGYIDPNLLKWEGDWKRIIFNRGGERSNRRGPRGVGRQGSGGSISILDTDSSRYRGLNLHSLKKHGTFEIRYHHGTVDKTEITNWIKLHLACIEYCLKNEREFITEAEIGHKIISPKRRAQFMFDMIGLDQEISSYYISKMIDHQYDDEVLIQKIKNNKKQ